MGLYWEPVRGRWGALLVKDLHPPPLARHTVECGSCAVGTGARGAMCGVLRGVWCGSVVVFVPCLQYVSNQVMSSSKRNELFMNLHPNLFTIDTQVGELHTALRATATAVTRSKTPTE